MKNRKKDKAKMPVFDSIRKPTAPPSRRLGENRPEELLHPSLRKVKHKPAKNDISGEDDER